MAQKVEAVSASCLLPSLEAFFPFSLVPIPLELKVAPLLHRSWSHSTPLTLHLLDHPPCLEVCGQILILPRQLEQHGVVEELVDRHVLAHSLPSPRLHHELARQVGGRRGLERLQHDALVQRISRHNRPVIKHLHAERLTLRVGAQVRLKAVRVHHRDVRLDGVQRRARLGDVLDNVPTSSGQDGVDGGQTVCRRLNLDIEYRLHQSRRGHKERRVADAPSCRDDLPTSSVNRRRIDRRVQNLEFNISNRFIT
mmetsp:Transcript_2842/g.6792  ORF Transcript_2842/g.6792 Transcript_2842/m.6792 type:complete len:253 (+) Transcript_2842:108-866(+)